MLGSVKMGTPPGYERPVEARAEGTAQQVGGPAEVAQPSGRAAAVIPSPGQPCRAEEGMADWGSGHAFLTLLLSCFSPPGFPLCLLLSLPGVSGGGKAQVFVKLMTCLCAKLTGGWTWTQTLLTASQPLCWHPQSLALAPCRLRPLPTPLLVAPAPQSIPELPGMPSLCPSFIRNKVQPPNPCALCSLTS